MRRFYAGVGYGLLVLGGIIGLTTDSQAAVQQPIYSTESSYYSGNDMVSKYQNFIAPPESTNTSTITSVTLRLKTDNQCGLRLKLHNTSLATYNSQNVTTTAGTAQNYTFTFSPNSNFHTGNLLKWQIDAGNSIGGCTLTADKSGYLYGSNSTASYSNGYWDTGSATLKNQFFVLNGSGGDVATSIWFTSTPTSTCDFGNFGVQSVFSASDEALALANNWVVGVRYGISESSMTYQVIDTVPCVTASCGSYGIPKATPLPSGLTYYAQAVISESSDLSSTGEHIATSDVWEFITTEQGCNATLVQSSIQGLQLPFATSTNGGDNLTCDSADSFFTNGMCNLFQYLFMPDERVLNKWNNELLPTLQNKPPFGYITAYADTFESITSATSTTSTVDISNLSQLGIVGTLQAALQWLVYLLGGIWVFNRLRTFSLHG